MPAPSLATLTEEQQMIVSEVRRFVEKEVMPVATELENRDQYPAQLVEQLRGLGMFGATIPEKYGGLELPFTTYAAIVEELSRGWMSLGGILNTHTMVSWMIKTYATEHVKSRLLPEMATGERRCGLCMTEPDAGSDLQAINTTELAFEDARVPAASLLGGEEGQGWLQIMSTIEIGRVNVASRAVGVASAALEDAIRYAKQRETFGQPIANHQAIQLMLAEMATKIEAARLLARAAAAKKDAGERADMWAGMAKLFCTEMAQEVVQNSFAIHGGYGYSKELRVERYYRDTPFMLIGEGTNEIQKLVIARNLLKMYGD